MWYDVPFLLGCPFCVVLVVSGADICLWFLLCILFNAHLGICSKLVLLVSVVVLFLVVLVKNKLPWLYV